VEGTGPVKPGNLCHKGIRCQIQQAQICLGDKKVYFSQSNIKGGII